MTPNSNGSSAGQGSSSPASGTDGTMYDMHPYFAYLPYAPAYVEGAFLNELDDEAAGFVSRYIFVAGLPDGTKADAVPDHELDTLQQQMRMYQCFDRCVPIVNRGIYLRFDDLDHATEAKALLEQLCFHTNFVSGWDMARAQSLDTLSHKEFEGSVKVVITVRPMVDINAWDFGVKDLADLTSAIQILAGVFGTVRACIHVDTDNENLTMTYRVEFNSIDAANRATQSLRAEPVYGVSPGNTFEWDTKDGVTAWVGEPASLSPHRWMPRIDDSGRLLAYPSRNSGVYRHPHDVKNRVDRATIMSGQDVRSTIMLRNIPNKMDWLSLKAMLDVICFGLYDFLYLRIDFISACNVGYAFINFSDIVGMLKLIDCLERRPWAGFRSSKAAEISYATIQGREALIQKFRNSSVMKESPFCHPRLFCSAVDATVLGRIRLIGSEQEFPLPDNMSKLNRSVESARSIGLYPPQGGVTTTDQRARTSDFDRGTPRDLEATRGAQLSATNMTFAGLTDDRKALIETWYSLTYGMGVLGVIPFNYIPIPHIQQWYMQYATGRIHVALQDTAVRRNVVNANTATNNTIPITPAHTAPVATTAANTAPVANTAHTIQLVPVVNTAPVANTSNSNDSTPETPTRRGGPASRTVIKPRKGSNDPFKGSRNPHA